MKKKPQQGLVFQLLFLFLMIVILTVTSAPAGITEEQPIADCITPWVPDLRINPYGGSETAPEIVSLYGTGPAYELFLPADADVQNGRIYFSNTDTLMIDGQAARNGDTCPALLQVGEHRIITTAENTEVVVNTFRSGNIPAVFISTTENSLAFLHESKNNRDTGLIRIHEEGKLVTDELLQQIRGRGNATWNYAKKPYNFKLEQKTDLLGMGKAKKWTLLANYVDPTLMHNALGWYLAEACGLYYTSAYRHVDLYINGEYLGNYILCESVEVGESRIAVTDLEKENEKKNGDPELYPSKGALPGEEDDVIRPGYVKGSYKWVDMPESPDNATGGYLLELDYEIRYDEEISGFVTGTGQSVVIKSPEHATKEEVEYIREVVENAEEALYSDSGYNQKGKHYSDYIDMDSLVSMYIIRELGNDIDAGLSSTYLTKPEDSDNLLVSPIWDMDRAFGDHLIRFGVDYGDPSIWWANSLYYYIGVNRIPTIFNAAYRHEDFRQKVREQWNQMENIGLFQDITVFLQKTQETLKPSAVMDAVRWNTYGNNDQKTIETCYAKVCDELASFITQRKMALDKGFSENAVMIWYDANGGTGGVFDPVIHLRGEEVTILDSIQEENAILPYAEGLVFSSWNTEPDGTGTILNPGDNYNVFKDTILYATWGNTELQNDDTEIIDIGNLVIREDRCEYNSDEAFGNYREIIPNKLYRSANPLFLNEKGAVIRDLMSKTGIQTVLNLSYDPEELDAAVTDLSLATSRYKSIYDSGNVLSMKMATGFHEDGFAQQLTAGLTFLAEHDPPYMFHCMGGRDRTGYVAMILEMLIGWDKEEVIKDYMITYTNYYGIEEGTGTYDQLENQCILSVLNELEAEYPSGSLKETAEAYLLANGMSEETLCILVNILQEKENPPNT